MPTVTLGGRAPLRRLQPGQRLQKIYGCSPKLFVYQEDDLVIVFNPSRMYTKSSAAQKKTTQPIFPLNRFPG